jgi:hypothetical protein
LLGLLAIGDGYVYNVNMVLPAFTGWIHQQKTVVHGEKKTAKVLEIA